MEIKDLQPKQGNVSITAKVVEKGEIREFQKFGKSGRVCNAIIEDASGRVKLSLWNEQIDAVNLGDMVAVTNGYVNEWQGELQLTSGRMGKIEVTGHSEVEAKAAEGSSEEIKPAKAKKNFDDEDLEADEVAEEESFEEDTIE